MTTKNQTVLADGFTSDQEVGTLDPNTDGAINRSDAETPEFGHEPEAETHLRRPPNGFVWIESLVPQEFGMTLGGLSFNVNRMQPSIAKSKLQAVLAAYGALSQQEQAVLRDVYQVKGYGFKTDADSLPVFAHVIVPTITLIRQIAVNAPSVVEKANTREDTDKLHTQEIDNLVAGYKEDQLNARNVDEFFERDTLWNRRNLVQNTVTYNACNAAKIIIDLGEKARWLRSQGKDPAIDQQFLDLKARADRSIRVAMCVRRAGVFSDLKAVFTYERDAQKVAVYSARSIGKSYAARASEGQKVERSTDATDSLIDDYFGVAAAA